MEKEIKNESLKNILKLPKDRATASVATKEKAGDSHLPSKEDCTAQPAPPSSTPECKPNFNAIYDVLHGKFPEIINRDRPVLLAVGIRKEMSNATGVSSVVLKKWIAWYCRKSNYYAMHKQGAIRFHLDGTEAGIVTEKHQEKMDKTFEKIKNRKSSPESAEEDIDKDSNNDTDEVVLDK